MNTPLMRLSYVLIGCLLLIPSSAFGAEECDCVTQSPDIQTQTATVSQPSDLQMLPGRCFISSHTVCVQDPLPCSWDSPTGEDFVVDANHDDAIEAKVTYKTGKIGGSGTTSGTTIGDDQVTFGTPITVSCDYHHLIEVEFLNDQAQVVSSATMDFVCPDCSANS